MTMLVSVHKITRPSQGPVSREIAGYDDDGEPIMKVVSEIVPPGSLFEHPENEAIELIEMGAARRATMNEIELGQASSDDRPAFGRSAYR